ncbi:MAG TPA: universal stress protein [Clostridia bacterium]|nr:universal stress protein [Clostridia bacterium]
MNIEPNKQGASSKKGLRIPEIRRVLVVTDFAEPASRAVEYAYSLLPRGGTVRILHLAKPFEFSNPVHASHPDAAHRLELERMRQWNDCHARLRALIPAGADGRGIRTEVEVCSENNPAIAICQAAASFGADLICMASHGKYGIAKSFLGSVTESVMNRSPTPVLIIGPGVHRSAQ